MAPPQASSLEVNGRESSAQTGPSLNGDSTDKYTTWVESSLIPRFREEAPSLKELCTELAGVVDEITPSKAFAMDEKPLDTASTPIYRKIQDDGIASKSLGQTSDCEAEARRHNQARLQNLPVLDDGFCEAFAEFKTYAHLDTLSEHPQDGMRNLAAKIKEIQLHWMDEERVEATWVTPNILLDGILGSVDPKTLQTLCETHKFKHVVMISIHPDDWVAGAAWKAHGRLHWTKRQSSLQEQASGVYERLLAPLWEQPERTPQIIVQNNIEYQSPVIDHLVIPLEDGDGSSLLMQLPDICTFIDQHTKPDVLIVIHCKVGLSRSNAGQEAFVLRSVYRELRKKANWIGKDSTEKQADLQKMCEIYHKSVQQRRPGLKSKFPNQMANWAKYLAENEPECGPDFATDQTSPGGNDMRDAAITACYELGYLLPPNLVSHYYKRRAADTETAQKTNRRFQIAEQERHAGMGRGDRQDAVSTLSVAEFVTLCKATPTPTSHREHMEEPSRPSKLG